jgi:hypothetical protein
LIPVEGPVSPAAFEFAIQYPVSPVAGDAGGVIKTV